MDVEAVLGRLPEAGVAVWLDEEDKLRVEKEASEELKELAREHKPY